MSVFEALQLIISEIENHASCGLLDEKTRKAKNILYSYVINKLNEEKEKGL